MFKRSSESLELLPENVCVVVLAVGLPSLFEKRLEDIDSTSVWVTFSHALSSTACD